MLVIGLGSDTGKKLWLAVCLAAGVLINLSSGTLWFAFVNGVSLPGAFAAAFAPFIVVEAVKMVMAFGIGVPVRDILKKSGAFGVKL
jgi:biotin transporter BioY